MSKTFLIEQSVDLELQQGDTGSLQFTVDDKLNLSQLVNPDYLFQAFRGSTLAFEKKAGDWTVTGQDLTAAISVADTENLYGDYSWGLKVTHDDGVHTIGKGTLTIHRKPLTV